MPVLHGHRRTCKRAMGCDIMLPWHRTHPAAAAAVVLWLALLLPCSTRAAAVGSRDLRSLSFCKAIDLGYGKQKHAGTRACVAYAHDAPGAPGPLPQCTRLARAPDQACAHAQGRDSSNVVAVWC